MRNALPLIPFILVIIAFPVSGDQTTEKGAWQQFSRGLELIIDNKTDQALEILEKVSTDFPGTDAAEKAAEYITRYSLRLDRSGIVTFYLGNIATTTWAASSIPLLFESDDALFLGAAGLIGVASGIYTSWLMSSDIDMSLGKDLWIEFIEAAAMANFQYSFALWGDMVPDPAVRVKMDIGGQALTSLASRGLTYLSVLDKDPPAGRIFTVINSYAWSQYYLWVSLTEIFSSENENFNNALALVIPDLAAWGSYYLWEKGGWSFQRTGIVSVSGIAGMLTGIFTDMIISEIGGFDPPSAVNSSIILGFSLAGKVVGAFATERMEPDRKADESIFANLSFSPFAGPHGTGIMVSMQY